MPFIKQMNSKKWFSLLDRAKMAACIFRLFTLFFVLNLFNIQFVISHNVGDSCSLKSGGSGVCKLVHDCDLWSLLSEGGEPNICGSIGYNKIVCCPKQQSKSYKKCLEYSKIKCSNSSRRSHTSTLASTHLILNGEKVKSVEEYPHMALLGYGSPNSKITWECGGTLISEQFILTAAHCVETRGRVPVTVAHLGFLNRNNRNKFNTLQEFRIIERIKYPKRRAPKVYHDIALLKLDRPAKLSKSVLPVCLHEEEDIPKVPVYATGWGQIRRDSQELSDDLMKVQLEQFSHNKCSPHFRRDRKLPDGILEEFQLCADGDKNRDTCFGDSGGPLQIVRTDNCMHSLVGITSVGIDCGLKPGIYTRVSRYVPWIESIVWPDR